VIKNILIWKMYVVVYINIFIYLFCLLLFFVVVLFTSLFHVNFLIYFDFNLGEEFISIFLLLLIPFQSFSFVYYLGKIVLYLI